MLLWAEKNRWPSSGWPAVRASPLNQKTGCAQPADLCSAECRPGQREQNQEAVDVHVGELLAAQSRQKPTATAAAAARLDAATRKAFVHQQNQTTRRVEVHADVLVQVHYL
eukprot:GHVT01009190.1.p2 GENE.GHVT01009190.1~~GHVT01009190.1.p2  ORF type:complete len:111 (+),score=15.81 GHVT01009190.1:535-867(+)